MSKINVNAKVESLGRTSSRSQDVEGHGTRTTVADNYKTSSIDPYSQLLSGRTKAQISPGPLAYLTGAEDAVNNSPPEDPMRAIIGSYMMGDYNAGRASVNDFELPTVPLCENIQNSLPGVRNIGIVERYQGLKITIQRLLNYANRLLRPKNAVRLSADEIKAVQDYRKALKDRLFICNRELGQAQADLKIETEERLARRTADRI